MDEQRTIIEWAALVLEWTGVAVIILAALYATAVAARRLLGGSVPEEIYHRYRRQLGRGILLGLEFLVAGDIINTVAIEPTFTSVGVLAVIVLVRTFLSFTLEVEMTGRWPWQYPKEEPLERDG